MLRKLIYTICTYILYVLNIYNMYFVTYKLHNQTTQGLCQFRLIQNTIYRISLSAVSAVHRETGLSRACKLYEYVLLATTVPDHNTHGWICAPWHCKRLICLYVATDLILLTFNNVSAAKQRVQRRMIWHWLMNWKKACKAKVTAYLRQPLIWKIWEKHRKASIKKAYITATRPPCPVPNRSKRLLNMSNINFANPGGLDAYLKDQRKTPKSLN
jgi:hypothetical protein